MLGKDLVSADQEKDFFFAFWLQCINSLSPAPWLPSDTTVLAYITSWKVPVRLQDKLVNREVQTFFPACLWMSAVCLGAVPWKAFTKGERKREIQRAIQTNKQTKNLKKKTEKGGRGTSQRLQRGGKNPPQKHNLSPSGPPNSLLYQRFIVNQLAEAAGVCKKGGSLRDNGLPCCITI